MTDPSPSRAEGCSLTPGPMSILRLMDGLTCQACTKPLGPPGDALLAWQPLDIGISLISTLHRSCTGGPMTYLFCWPLSRVLGDPLGWRREIIASAWDKGAGLAQLERELQAVLSLPGGFLSCEGTARQPGP